VTKRQISGASNKRAKEMMKNKEKGKIIMTRRRPDDIDMLKFSLSVCAGFVGAHNFFVGRKIRGWIMMGCMIAYIVFFAIFPPPSAFYPGSAGSPMREAMGGFFPTDFLGVFAMIVWFYDIFAIVLLRTFKYPARLAEFKDGQKE